MTPTQMAEAAIAADRSHADPGIWITRRPDEAILADARALEAEGPMGRPLWGVPFAVKDNIDVAGLPTTAGCPGFAFTPADDAPAVRRLLDAGALLIGKTNLDQFATGLVGTRSPYGVPRNVFDANLIPGGSSSGSAVAVAAGIVQFALGTDTAGSGSAASLSKRSSTACSCAPREVLWDVPWGAPRGAAGLSGPAPVSCFSASIA